MQWRGLSRKDLEPYIGSCARIADVLIRSYERKRAA
jgi:antitoxin component HigA of HigAB toxin-antitoxin module